MAKGRTQEGSALVVATLLVIACIGLVFAIELASPAGNARADRASERALADGTFRAQVVAETRAWFDAHPEEAQGIVELFAPQAAA